MAVTHPAGVRQSVCDFIVDKLDVGAAAQATLEFQTAGSVEVATLNMTAKGSGAFGASNGSGVATAAAITADSSATGGTTTKAVFKDCNGAEVFSCSVGAGSGDISLNSNVISAGQQVSVTSLTYTAMP